MTNRLDCGSVSLNLGQPRVMGILDLPPESTRPGAAPVPLDEELRRVMPIVERLVELDTIISIDTAKPGVAGQRSSEQ